MLMSEINSRTEAELKIQSLKSIIAKHDHLYYVEDNPTISDAEYDSFMRGLRSLEKQFPDLIASDSPTQRVGGKSVSSFKNVRHVTPMLSLDNVFNDDEFTEWYRARCAELGLPDLQLSAEPKYDGLAVDLKYEDGVLTQALTRGDGDVGEDVTANVRTIKTVPLRFSSLNSGIIHVRGEVYLSIENFNRYNADAKNRGLKPYVNPRNAAAGALRQHDTMVTAALGLSFHPYGIAGVTEELDFVTTYQKLREFGFQVNGLIKTTNTLETALSAYTRLMELRPSLPLEIDGVVFKISTPHQRKQLGYTNRAPKWGIAFKFPATDAYSTLLGCEWQVGRTGRITPVANIAPTYVGGVTVSRVTLHNKDEIARLGILVGDTVVVRRAGDVIPQIVRVLVDKRPKDVVEISVPEKCPVCNSPIDHVTSSISYCTGSSVCDAQIRGNLYHYVSRESMNIKGVGEKLIDSLVDRGLLYRASDFYKLTDEQLITKANLSELMSKKIISAIDVSLGASLERLLGSLGIDDVGPSTAKSIAQHFVTIDNVVSASLSDLQNVRDVGPVAAAAIRRYFDIPENLDMVMYMRQIGVFVDNGDARISSELEGQTYVITGSFKSSTRQDIESLIKSKGGNVSNSVSKTTTGLIVGDNPGSKLQKAKNLNVPLIYESGLVALAKS